MDENVHFALDPDMTTEDWEAFKLLAELQQAKKTQNEE